MLINYYNINESFSKNNLTFHDYSFDSLIYESNNLIRLYLLDRDEKRIELAFSNVIGCEFTSCNFWGASSFVDCISYLEYDKKVITPKLNELFMDSTYTPYKEAGILSEDKEFIEIKVGLSSGDYIIIACETLVIP